MLSLSIFPPFSLFSLPSLPSLPPPASESALSVGLLPCLLFSSSWQDDFEGEREELRNTLYELLLQLKRRALLAQYFVPLLLDFFLPCLPFPSFLFCFLLLGTQDDFEGEREELRGTLHELSLQLKRRALLTQYFVPPEYMQLIEDHSKW